MYVPFLNNNALEIALQGLAILKGNDDKTYTYTYTLHYTTCWKHKMNTYAILTFRQEIRRIINNKKREIPPT